MAALIDVPLPFNTPDAVVDKVITGVDVDVATVPAKPFADVTETEVTVPPLDGAIHDRTPDPLVDNIYPLLPLDVGKCKDPSDGDAHAPDVRTLIELVDELNQ